MSFLLLSPALSPHFPHTADDFPPQRENSNHQKGTFSMSSHPADKRTHTHIDDFHFNLPLLPQANSTTCALDLSPSYIFRNPASPVISYLLPLYWILPIKMQMESIFPIWNKILLNSYFTQLPPHLFILSIQISWNNFLSVDYFDSSFTLSLQPTSVWFLLPPLWKFISPGHHLTYISLHPTNISKTAGHALFSETLLFHLALLFS